MPVRPRAPRPVIGHGNSYRGHGGTFPREMLNPGFPPRSGNPDVAGIPQVNYNTSQQQLTSMQAKVAYLTKTPITTKPVVRTN